MGLKDRVERMGKRVLPPREPITLSWFDPDTGEVLWSLTATPCPGNSGYTVAEQFSQE